MKLSFKNDPKETGLAAVCYPHVSAVIKADGKEIGGISYDRRKCGYEIRLMIKDDAERNGWKNIFLKRTFGRDIKEVKEWLKTVWPQLQERYKFHHHED